MTLSDPELWQRISEFRFDEEGASFTFTNRLVQENSWDQNLARKIIEEYKKFIYLACVSNEQITPSNQVDQVWHLHLSYTRNYWNKFCAETLGREIHHDPTQGGLEEGKKFMKQYENTKWHYKKEFGYEPPRDIWPSSVVRFSAQSSRWSIFLNRALKGILFGMILLLFLQFFLASVFHFIIPGLNYIWGGGIFLIFLLAITGSVVDTSMRVSGGDNGTSDGDGCGSSCGGGCGGG